MAQVLVVEDEDVTRLMLETRLHFSGHRVHVAASMAEAQEMMAGVFIPDVIVSDMFMPGGSGLSLVESLIDDPDRADVPVIFLSARALPGDVSAGTALGATYLNKPVSIDDLNQAIEDALEAGAAARGETVRAHLTEVHGMNDDQERALFASMLTAFVDNAPAMSAAIEAALEAGDPAALEAAAHKLRGSAATLGAEPLALLCQRLEETALAGELPSFADVAPGFARELAMTCGVFQDLVEELTGGVSATTD